MYVQRNNEARSSNCCYSVKATRIAHSVCVCVCVCSLWYPASNVCESHYHTCPAWLYNIFPHQTARLSKNKKLLNTKCVFWFSLQFLTETFLFLRIIGRDTIRGLHVKCQLFLSDINETWIFSIDFRKIIVYQISWKSVQWERSSSMRTDWWTGKQTDRHYETNSRFS
jgi:hypothetical protein